MIRVFAFFLAIVLCLGAVGYVYHGISGLTDQVTFSENVRFGDPAVLDGRSAQFSIRCGDYLMWNIDYRFGSEDSWDTDFLLSQKKIKDQNLGREEYLSIYQHSGFHMSGSSVPLGDSGYADMVRAVAAMAPIDEKFSMNLKLRDYMEYHSFQYDLHYSSDRYVADEAWDLLSGILSPSDHITSYCHEGLTDLFRFPVLEDHIVTISISVSAATDVTNIVRDLGYNDEYISRLDLPNAITDEGIWCVPMYIAGDENPRVVPCPHKLGMGIYFIPWRVVEDGSVYDNNRQRVTPDTDNAVNIHPLPEDAVIFDLAPDDSGKTLRMLSLENGRIVLTLLDMEENRMISRLELMEFTMENAYDRPPHWCLSGDLIVIQSDSNLTLVSLGEEPKVEFIAPLGEVAAGLHYFTQPTGAIVYEDGILYLADYPYYNEILNVMVFDEAGPLYWGEYTCSLMTQGGDNGSPIVMPYYGKTGLK